MVVPEVVARRKRGQTPATWRVGARGVVVQLADRTPDVTHGLVALIATASAAEAVTILDALALSAPVCRDYLLCTHQLSGNRRVVLFGQGLHPSPWNSPRRGLADLDRDAHTKVGRNDPLPLRQRPQAQEMLRTLTAGRPTP